MSEEKNNVIFMMGEDPIIELKEGGEIFVKGKLVDNDKEVVEGMREFLLKAKDDAIKPERYIQDVLVTESCDWDKVQSRLDKPQIKRLLHAAMGMVTEAGELMDMLKKHIFYGKELDLVNVEEELGDSNWYQSVAIDALRKLGHVTGWNQIWEKNIAKLKARYGDKFDEGKAVNRDLDAERDILEGK